MFVTKRFAAKRFAAKSARRLAPLVLAALCGTASALDIFGQVGLEARYFLQSPQDDAQVDGFSASLNFEPQFYHAWDSGRQSIAVVPYLRLDQYDAERSHFDMRELTYVKAAQSWELRAGIRKVFWGVIEFQHLVDVINQTDAVENLDGEDKLGQPMLNLALIKDWGTVDLFLMPYFRERTFSGREGRFRPATPVDMDEARYESGAAERHVDVAVRYAGTFGDYDIGFAHFAGTSRDPRILSALDAQGDAFLYPFYDQIHQTSLDLQVTRENILWKLEALHRSGQGESYYAAAGGFEYTFYGVFGTPWDIGALGEYHYDERGKSAPSGLDDEIALGVRLAMNDAQSTDAIAGILVDRDTGARFFSVEASRRIGDSWVLELQARFLQGQRHEDPAYGISKDDYIELYLSYNF
ncbi:MAG: hypothetical protein WC997_16530 [Porticoccaceae bacterium]